MRTIPKIVLTGGPCSGKTSAIAVLTQKLPELGIKPIFAPETATAFLSSGVSHTDIFNSDKNVYSFQSLIFDHQIETEAAYHTIAQFSPNSVLILDRGLMDGKAYVSHEQFLEMIENKGYSISDAMSRYSGVIHLVTAADGAVEYYNLDNPARHESPEEAVAVDRRLQDVWSGHPSFRIVGNTDSNGERIDFGKKMDRVISEICALVGVPTPVKTERKFLIEHPVLARIPVHMSEIKIRQTYLERQNSDIERRVRRWRFVGGKEKNLYFYTEKWAHGVKNVSRFFSERQITVDEYVDLLDETDTECSPIVKTRFCFTLESQYFEMDHVQSPYDFWVLGVPSANNVSFPPFLRILKEVTEDTSYNMQNVALGLLREKE